METKTENPDFTCSRYFGCLSQLSEAKETPNECLICKKLLECKFAKSDTATHRKASKTVAIEKAKQPVEGPTVYSVKSGLENVKDENKTKPSPIDFSGKQFTAENLVKKYAIMVRDRIHRQGNTNR